MSVAKFWVLLSLAGYTVHAQRSYEWAVIGAGPAGIILISQLLEQGVSDHDIVWIDPEFTCGRLGKYYGNVQSNQKAIRFTRFLKKSSIFSAVDTPAAQVIKSYNPQKEHPLQLAVNVFNDVTQHLRTRVVSLQDGVLSLTTDQGFWRLTLENQTVHARTVILATGSYPKRLGFNGFDEIPLDTALDKKKLRTVVTPHDKVIVVGSAHSALLVVKYLSEISVQKVINFYSKEPTYGVYGGLEGTLASWAQDILMKKRAPHVTRIPYRSKELEQYQYQSYKIIYAYGYEQNPLMIDGSTILTYDLETGKIQDNLYGIGIAFPECYRSSKGKYFPLIGVNSFMKRAKKLVSILIKSSTACLT